MNIRLRKILITGAVCLVVALTAHLLVGEWPEHGEPIAPASRAQGAGQESRGARHPERQAMEEPSGRVAVSTLKQGEAPLEYREVCGSATYHDWDALVYGEQVLSGPSAPGIYRTSKGPLRMIDSDAGSVAIFERWRHVRLAVVCPKYYQLPAAAIVALGDTPNTQEQVLDLHLLSRRGGGYCELQGWPSELIGRVSLKVDGFDWAPRRLELSDVCEVDPDLTGLEFILTPLQLPGRFQLVSSDGLPIADMPLSFYSFGEQSLSGQVSTDRDGFFEAPFNSGSPSSGGYVIKLDAVSVAGAQTQFALSAATPGAQIKVPGHLVCFASELNPRPGARASLVVQTSRGSVALSAGANGIPRLVLPHDLAADLILVTQPGSAYGGVHRLEVSSAAIANVEGITEVKAFEEDGDEASFEASFDSDAGRLKSWVGYLAVSNGGPTLRSLGKIQPSMRYLIPRPIFDFVGMSAARSDPEEVVYAWARDKLSPGSNLIQSVKPAKVVCSFPEDAIGGVLRVAPMEGGIIDPLDVIFADLDESNVLFMPAGHWSFDFRFSGGDAQASAFLSSGNESLVNLER